MRQVTEVLHRRYVSHLKPLSGWPPVTALIDLLFLTVLALGIAALHVRVSGIPVELPAASPTAVGNLERSYTIVIRHAPDKKGGCILYFKDESLDGDDVWGALRQKMNQSKDAKAKTSPSAILYADRNVSPEVIAKAMSVAVQAGFKPFWMVVEPGAKAPILVK